ncbi:MAG: hypothetical protein R3283_06315 [Balneolaceae bacterium]|nr:hypothetical protein [Balneolaceae bacterium]
MEQKEDNKAFKQILTWSLAMFVVAIVFGLLYRIIMPIERHLGEDEYIDRVFVEFETTAWNSNHDNASPLGTFDGGSILYVVEKDSSRSMVRPFIISALDSVWVNSDELIIYTPDRYKNWQYEEERRKYDLN